MSPGSPDRLATRFTKLRDLLVRPVQETIDEPPDGPAVSRRQLTDDMTTLLTEIRGQSTARLVVVNVSV